MREVSLDVYGVSERLMSMSDDVWRRHANPWSVWTRFSCLPLIVLAIWSRVWLGWWALLPLGAALLWTWLNPRAFPPATSFAGWAPEAVIGERVFLEHRSEVGAHHIRATRTLTALSAAGAMVMVWGLWALDVWATVFGMTVAVMAKVWFCDRMVWILRDRRAAGLPAPGDA